MTLAPWILWLIPFARADGPATSSTSASTTSSAVSNVEMVRLRTESPTVQRYWLEFAASDKPHVFQLLLDLIKQLAQTMVLKS